MVYTSKLRKSRRDCIGLLCTEKHRWEHDVRDCIYGFPLYKAWLADEFTVRIHKVATNGIVTLVSLKNPLVI